MIIDFHTHVFPDKIAQATVNALAKASSLPPYSDGTVAALVNNMKAVGIDLSVNLPVLTSPKQFDSVLSFAKGINEAHKNGECPIISFAGIHPGCDDIDGKMKLVKESGIPGVKIHPDYQGTFINDEGYIRILEAAKEYDLIVVTHAGLDEAYRESVVKCTPKLTKEVIKRVKHPKLVLAHIGANEMADDVIDMLCAEDVYFDTAYSLPFIAREKFEKIVSRHGADRILFATDSPWGDLSHFIKVLDSYSLCAEDKNKIFSENAKRILGI